MAHSCIISDWTTTLLYGMLGFIGQTVVVVGYQTDVYYVFVWYIHTLDNYRVSPHCNPTDSGNVDIRVLTSANWFMADQNMDYDIAPDGK